jgi:hypothetical protein
MIRIDGGYLILNYQRYRDKDHTSAARSKRYRERLASRVDTSRHGVISRDVTQAEAEAEAEADPDRTPLRTGRKRKCRMPEGWAPSSTPAIQRLERGLDRDAELDAFRDRVTRDGATYLDWDAAWRTWLRNAHKFRKATPLRQDGPPRGFPPSGATRVGVPIKTQLKGNAGQ